MASAAALLLPPPSPNAVKKTKMNRSTHLCLIACRSKSAAFDELMLLSCDAVVAMLAVRGARGFLDEAGLCCVALVGLAGAVGRVVACSVDMVGMALDDLTFR